MTNSIQYAPIYIPTLCRDKHFILGVESLKTNSWAKYTDVYIALDYPAKESHWEGYRKICDYLANGDFSAFASFHVVKRTENIGSLANIDSIRDMLMERYDRWIMAEDDIEFAPVVILGANFFESGRIESEHEVVREDRIVVLEEGSDFSLVLSSGIYLYRFVFRHFRGREEFVELLDAEVMGNRPDSGCRTVLFALV